MTARSPQDKGAEWFTAPAQVNQRRYEALRAFYVDGLTHAQAGERFGYTRWAMVNLVREQRAGRLELFAAPRRPGPAPGVAPAKDRARGRVIELRREGLSSYEISRRLAGEGTPLNRTSVAEILTEEGFGRLLRHPEPAASISPATPGRDTRLPRTGRLDFATWPASVETGKAGLLLVVPDLVALDLPDLVRAAGYPGTRVVPALSWLLSLLALKLTRTRRVSHVDDLLLADPAAALFAGLSVLPKKTALTDYSYATTHAHQRRFLAALDTNMIKGGLATGEDAIFDLDFHAVMHWGQDPVLEKHYVPTRSQRARSVLTFFAQDSGTHNLVYANAEVAKASQAREVIAFCEHWNTASGADPHMLIMDQKVTTQTVLAELDSRGVKFLTLRMRSPALVAQINALASTDYKTITLNRPGRYNRPRVHESRVPLSNYPGTVRQLIVTGLGRDAPTVIITNNDQLSAKALIEHYARRMTIEQRLAEIIQAFHADALSSTVNLNVDLDIMLCVLAQALLAALRARLPGYRGVTPDVLQRRFLETPGTITTTADTITVHLDRRAYSPILRTAGLPNHTTVPWWETAPCATKSPDPLPRTSCAEIRANGRTCRPLRRSLLTAVAMGEESACGWACMSTRSTSITEGRDHCGRGTPGWRWLDLAALSASLIDPGLWLGAVLDRVVYCTAPRDRAGDPTSIADEQTYISALRTGPVSTTVVNGQYAPRVKAGDLVDQRGRRVPSPGLAALPGWLPAREVSGPDGNPVLRARITTFEEKGSDVNVASHVLIDVLDRQIDAAIVYSNDSDLRLPDGGGAAANPGRHRQSWQESHRRRATRKPDGRRRAPLVATTHCDQLHVASVPADGRPRPAPVWLVINVAYTQHGCPASLRARNTAT